MRSEFHTQMLRRFNGASRRKMLGECHRSHFKFGDLFSSRAMILLFIWKIFEGVLVSKWCLSGSLVGWFRYKYISALGGHSGVEKTRYKHCNTKCPWQFQWLITKREWIDKWRGENYYEVRSRNSEFFCLFLIYYKSLLLLFIARSASKTVVNFSLPRSL